MKQKFYKILTITVIFSILFNLFHPIPWDVPNETFKLIL